MLNPIQQNFTIKPNLQRRNNISFGTKIDPHLKNLVNCLINSEEISPKAADLLSEIENDGQPGKLFIEKGKIVLKIKDLPRPIDEVLKVKAPEVLNALRKLDNFQYLDFVKGINIYRMVEESSIMNPGGRYCLERDTLYNALDPKRIKNIQESAKKSLHEYMFARLYNL